ncbi:unnamed protein product [Ilex paraguariensis]|uniref:Helicase protein MOM1 n=1 Tax=Ilex paraguariensis TaxID=185542 RepID=A0ABC8T7F6_9AQUA
MSLIIQCSGLHMLDLVRGKDRSELQASATTGLADKKSDDSAPSKETPLNSKMDDHENVCVICKLGGKLLCCDGKSCKGSYHLSCLDPALDDVPPGVWHCFWCVKKKIESGVHSVSDGVESIWDAKEVEVSDAKGLQKQKQYFVKYQGLAHIHNQWVPETQLLLEAPSLISKYNRKNQGYYCALPTPQVTKWNAEWTVPHRLLRKRMLRFPKQQQKYHSGQAGEFSDNHCEWLVKWCGLDYKHATWELENVSFLPTPRGQDLVREYDNRREKAKRAGLTVDKVPLQTLSSSLKTKKEFLILPKLPVVGSPEIDSNHLNSVNKLREHWHKNKNVVVIDDQDRVMKVILFIQSLPNVYQPFLIIATSNALPSWEAEFLRLAPSVDVVIYSGNRDTRRSIRTLEFYEEGGNTMFQVLLSPPEAVVEDLEMLECLRWEAVIIDECQRPRISAHFEQFKMLATDTRFLLLNGQVKDSMAEYLNLLSLLDCRGDLDSSNVSNSESNDHLSKLKERLSQFIAYDCKTDSSRFLEFWVPVQISNMQLEKYCATLLSNSIPLCSCSKNDPVGAVRDILISTRKCCDHPYILDPSLVLLTKGLSEAELLDFGIKASGKLHLLDTILSEMKNRQLRVLILFQSIGGSGRNSIGDILDDFLRQRFGPDSYERVDAGVVPSKKQAALNNFNRESGRFVFLLENRACLPSIKLSSVDAIIIYGSDWNPMNDIRALHRITIDSQFEQIKILRLYSSCTVEEKILTLAKQDQFLDSNLQNVSRSASDILLMWGASYLFDKLDEFHSGNTPASSTNISSEQSLMHDAVKEVLAILSQNGNDNDLSNSMILKVQHSGGPHRTNLPLPGELKVQSTDGEQPNFFWTKLLHGRNPQWKYLSLPTQRSRKRVQYYEQSPKKPEVETDEVGKKRKKLVSNCIDPTSPKPGVEEGEVAMDKGAFEAFQNFAGTSGIPADNGAQSVTGTSGVFTNPLHPKHTSRPLFSGDNSLLTEAHMVQSEERTLSDAQGSLHLLLKPEISRLCEILNLSVCIPHTPP